VGFSIQVMPQINFLYLKSGLFKNEIEEMSVIFDIFIEFIGKKVNSFYVFNCGFRWLKM